jgi:hypothetical protein
MPRHDPLAQITLFETGLVPHSRRKALQELVDARRTEACRAISSGALALLCAFFCLIYGGLSGCAWLYGGHPVFGISLSILSGACFLIAANLAGQSSRHRAAMPTATEKLRQEAETEELLDQARRDVNHMASLWNQAVSDALAVEGLSEVITVNLVRQRLAIDARRRAFKEGLRRFFAATAPAVRAVPPPSVWGRTERVDLTA